MPLIQHRTKARYNIIPKPLKRLSSSRPALLPRVGFFDFLKFLVFQGPAKGNQSRNNTRPGISWK